MASGTDVMLPEGHEVVAMDRLMQLQQDHAVLDRPLAAIDLRLPDRLVLRPAHGSSESISHRLCRLAGRIPPPCRRPRSPWSRRNPPRSTSDGR